MTRKILLVSPSLQIGGIERTLTTLANYFNQKGHKVIFVSCSNNSPFFILEESIDVQLPPYDHKGGIISMLAFYPRLVFYIRKQVKFHRPDVVMTFGEYLNPIVIMSLMGINIPVFISDRSSPDYRFRPFVHLIFTVGKRLFYKRSAGFIAQTKRFADYIDEYFNGKLNIRIIPNPVKLVTVIPLTKKKWIVCVGRLSIEKGQDRLINAFSLIGDKLGWKLVFAGNGPRSEDLRKLCDKLNLGNDVIFLGKVINIDQLLSESSIFVLPSRLEGFPNALCEAMAAGLPCLCYDTFPTDNIITENYDGYIIKDNDLKSMAEKIEYLMNSPAERERLSNNALKIRERLSVSRIGDLFLEFILNQPQNE